MAAKKEMSASTVDEPKKLAAVFDFDNTLLLSEATKHDCMRVVAGRFAGGLDVLAGVPYDSRTAPRGVVVTRHTIFAGVAKGLVEDHHLDLAREGHADAAAFGVALTTEFSALVEERMKQAKEVPGASALLRHLAAHNVRCYVNTATPQEPIDATIDMLGWRPYFRGVYGTPGTKVVNLRRAAEDAAAGTSHAARGSLPPRLMVHVGDGDNDCKAASEFGCAFIGIDLPRELGGSGSGFSRACNAIVPDMHLAGPPLCALLGIPPPPPPSVQADDEGGGEQRKRRSYGNRGGGGCRCVDLGFVLSETCVSWPSCQPLARQILKAPETSQPPGARGKQAFSLNGGTGTHIDAPAHFVVGGRTVEQLTTSELVGVPLIVIDAPPRAEVHRAAEEDTAKTCSAPPQTKRPRHAVHAEAPPEEAAAATAAAATAASATASGASRVPNATECAAETMLSAADVHAHEAAYGHIPPGALVCVRTGWAAQRYSDRAAYYNAIDASDIDEYIGLPRMRFPGITAEAATLLVRDRGCAGIGIDSLSPDGGGGAAAGFPAHHVILGADRYILENLHLPGELPARGATVVVAPLNVQGAPEAPARVFAMIGDRPD